MPVVRRLDAGKLWAAVVAVAIGGVAVMAVVMVLAHVSLTLLLIREASPPASARPPAVAAEQTPADWSPDRSPDRSSGEPAAPYQGPADPTASQAYAYETTPGPRPGAPDDAEDPTPSATEQRVFRSRRALETIDPREILRQAKGQE
jgi:hypothetical protein